jgi:hypothetical protein
MDERRQELRARSLLTGMITFNDGKSAMGCSVRNLSPHGAMIVCSELFRMAKDFGLAIPHREERHRAEIVWRVGDKAGVVLSPVQTAERKRETRNFWLQGSPRRVNKSIVLGY